MFKNIFSFIRFMLILLLWSYFSFVFARFLFIYLWKFDILMLEYWKLLAKFWNEGGVIKTAKDYAFALSIIISPIIWVYLFIKLVKFDYTKLISVPLNFLDNMTLKGYSNNIKRVVIKNLSSKDNLSFDDLVAKKIKEEEKKAKEKEKSLEADNIRENIQKKISKKT